MRNGYTPKFSVGFSTYLGHPCFWKANGPEPIYPNLYFVSGDWGDFENSIAVILVNTAFTCRRDSNGGDSVSLVSVTDKERQHRFATVVESSILPGEKTA